MWLGGMTCVCPPINLKRVVATHYALDSAKIRAPFRPSRGAVRPCRTPLGPGGLRGLILPPPRSRSSWREGDALPRGEGRIERGNGPGPERVNPPLGPRYAPPAAGASLRGFNGWNGRARPSLPAGARREPISLPHAVCGEGGGGGRPPVRRTILRAPHPPSQPLPPLDPHAPNPAFYPSSANLNNPDCNPGG